MKIEHPGRFEWSLLLLTEWNSKLDYLVTHKFAYLISHLDTIRVCLKYAGYSTADKQSDEYAKLYDSYLRISTLWGRFEEYPRIYQVSCLKLAA